MSEQAIDLAAYILRRNRLRIERQTVHHSRYDTDLMNWHEYYSHVGRKPTVVYRTAIRVPIPALMDAA